MTNVQQQLLTNQNAILLIIYLNFLGFFTPSKNPRSLINFPTDVFVINCVI